MRSRESTSVYFVYVTGPLDWWPGWRWVDEILAAMRGSDTLVEAGYPEPSKLEAMVSSAKKVADAAGWEGDGRWACAPLPAPEMFSSELMFAVKQSNNGTTYVVSPFRLPWLEPQPR